MTTIDTRQLTDISNDRTNFEPTTGAKIDRGALRLAAAMAGVGEVVFLASGFFHPATAEANDHRAAFAEYAASARWALVHIGQFVGTTLVLGGILALLFSLRLREPRAAWTARFAAVSAVVAMALYGVLQAVDGVALKHAVDAWVSAPLAEKAAASRAAEAIRWLEWGVRSFAHFMQGASLLLLAGIIISTRRPARAIGYLAGIAGVAYVVQGYILNTEGFSMNGHLPGALILLFDLAWIVGLVIVAVRTTGRQSE